MRNRHLIKFIATVAITCLSTCTWSQTCSTTKSGSWSDPTVWSCGFVPGIGTNQNFTGTINVTYAINLPSSSTIRITGQVTVNVTGGGSIDLGNGAKFEVVNANSTIVLGSPSNLLSGGNSASTLNVAGKYCTGPFNGSNQIAGSRTISFNNPACANFQLPVTLLSFTAQPEGDRVQLAWATTYEQNASQFIVERSADLGEYVPVGVVAATGSSDGRKTYGLTDRSPLPGVNYYRLRQIDRDGTVQTFKPISVIVLSTELVASVYPNPADASRIHLRLLNADEAVVRLLTLAGQPVESRLERRLDEADLVLQHPVPAGVYLLEVRTNGQKRTSKVLIR